MICNPGLSRPGFFVVSNSPALAGKYSAKRSHGARRREASRPLGRRAAKCSSFRRESTVFRVRMVAKRLSPSSQHMPDVETPSQAWFHVGFCCQSKINKIMPLGIPLGGRAREGTESNCPSGLSAICVRARFVCVRVIAGNV